MIDRAIEGLLNAKYRSVKRVTMYLSPKRTIKITRQQKLDLRASQDTFLVTIGQPNFAERGYIKTLIAAKEPFPVKKWKLAFYSKHA
jgi:hypothetical protein